MVAHKWKDFYPRFFCRHRRCQNCGLVQQFSSASRRIGGSSGGWYPPAKKCGLVNLKLKRIRAGNYETSDGIFEIVKEPDENRQYGCPSRWFIGQKDCDETICFDGFRTKRDAVEWLAMNALDFVGE